mgnify:FL=1
MTIEYDQSEAELFRDNLKRYVETEIMPHYEQWEKDGIIPREVWNQLGEAGFLCVDIPEEYGGFDVDFRFSMVVLEEFCRKGCIGVGGGMAVHSDIVAHYVLNAGSEEQKLKYLPKMVSGEAIGAIAMTEPGAGSDLQGLRTSAKLDGEEYVINGSKTFISNGQHCDFAIVAAKTDVNAPGAKGISLFIVDANTQGFVKGSNLDKIGCHSADTSELFFEDVRVPKSAMLGELNQGFIVMMKELQRERLSLAVCAVAAAEGSLESTIEYVKERKAFGKAISDFQNTRFKLAEMATDIRINKAFVEECTYRHSRRELDVTSVSMAKLASTEMQGRVVDGCLQLFGGYGYMTEYPISRAFVDARVQRIYGGTSEIMKEIISRDLIK